MKKYFSYLVSLNHLLFFELGNLLPCVAAHFLQNFLSMLPELRRFGSNLGGGLAKLKRRTQHFYRTQSCMIVFDNIFIRKDLRVIFQVSDSLDKATGDITGLF